MLEKTLEKNRNKLEQMILEGESYNKILEQSQKLDKIIIRVIKLTNVKDYK